MKVIAATLLALLAAPSALAANTRRLGAADVSNIDNQSFSMDMIENAAAGEEVSIRMILTLICPDRSA